MGAAVQQGFTLIEVVMAAVIIGGVVVYEVPQRDYTFDTDFLDAALLPPLTPMFRDLNALGFTQETRPGK
jgi:prepilin-type N-terminal cleavage/methylation domain-containing protein